MLYRFLADAVLLLHLGFILFVVFGALLVARRRGWLPVQLAAAGWGVLVEASGAACPLTWAELYFRRLAGDAGYQGGFIDHYLVPLIYPAGLTRGLQVGLGLGVIAINAILYTWIRRRRARAPA
ncbi:DUF2784 domain-containing protein [Massilia sp. LXY-6]|uniref:DUF2784 domain-containing protein n=1 Tax=Massilia sp. LXY-6 TaxID=3379823 RepID=UPI003EE26632